MVSKIFLLNFTGGSVTKPRVKTLVIIITFDIFKNSLANLVDVFKHTKAVQPFTL